MGVFLLQPVDDSDKSSSSTDPALMPVKKALFALQSEKSFQQLDKEQQLEKTVALLEQLPPEYKRLKRQYQIALSSVPDILFYGRVIDQHGAPVVNAAVYYTGTNNYLAAGAGRGRVFTDEQGYFEIDTEGSSLMLNGVVDSTLDRTVFPIQTKYTTLDGMPGIMRFLPYDDNQGIASNWKNHSVKDKAYVIHAWRLGEYEGAIAGSTDAYYDRDGSDYTLILDGHNQYPKKGKTEGHFHISCTRPHMENGKDYGDWRVSIAPVNGGIQEVAGLYVNLAPLTGYQSSIDITMRKGSPDYKHELLNKRYYFTSNNGKEYGTLFMYIKPFGFAEKEACALSINYKINPTGSRNLELKLSKTSQPTLVSPQKLARASN